MTYCESDWEAKIIFEKQETSAISPSYIGDKGNIAVTDTALQSDLCAQTKVQIAVFLALGGAAGRGTLRRACDLLADLSRDDSVDCKTRAILDRLVAGAIANLEAA